MDLDLTPPVPWPDTPRPMVTLRPGTGVTALAAHRNDPTPTQVSTYTVDHVMNLRSQGLTFTEIAARAPECLSTSGAFLVYSHGLWAATSRALHGEDR